MNVRKHARAARLAAAACIMLLAAHTPRDAAPPLEAGPPSTSTGGSGIRRPTVAAPVAGGEGSEALRAAPGESVRGGSSDWNTPLAHHACSEVGQERPRPPWTTANAETSSARQDPRVAGSSSPDNSSTRTEPSNLRALRTPVLRPPPAHRQRRPRKQAFTAGAALETSAAQDDRLLRDRNGHRRAPPTGGENRPRAVDLQDRRRRAASLFAPPHSSGRAIRSVRHRQARFHPPRLSRLLGPKPLRPPPAGLRPPAILADLPRRLPPRDAVGAVLPSAACKLEAIEGILPETFADDRRRDPHWDEGSWHQGRTRAVVRSQGWVGVEKSGARWWGLVGQEPLVRHRELWWIRRQGVWLVIHQGEPWAWRHYQDWDAEGLFHPATGTEIVYSSDLSRAAVITPGEGAVVYDASTGTEIGRIPEELMPARRRPKAPESLSIP